MNESNKNALKEIIVTNIENHMAFQSGEIKSVQHGDKRLGLMRKGLQLIADSFNFPAVIGHCDSRGEFGFAGNNGNPNEGCQGFGKELAALLSQIETRTGISSRKGEVLPENGWCNINHFDVERLLHIAADIDAGIAIKDKNSGKAIKVALTKQDELNSAIHSLTLEVAKESGTSLELTEKNTEIVSFSL